MNRRVCVVGILAFRNMTPVTCTHGFANKRVEILSIYFFHPHRIVQRHNMLTIAA